MRFKFFGTCVEMVITLDWYAMKQECGGSAVVGYGRMGTPFLEIFGLLMFKKNKKKKCVFFPVSESESERIIYTRFKKIAFHFPKVFQNFCGKNYRDTGKRKRLAFFQTNASICREETNQISSEAATNSY